MTFAVILLVLLVVACAVGSFVKQGQTFDWYAASYSETAAAWIMALRLNDTFHSWWFFCILRNTGSAFGAHGCAISESFC